MGNGIVVPRTLNVVLEELSSSQATALMAETEPSVPIVQQAGCIPAPV